MAEAPRANGSGNGSGINLPLPWGGSVKATGAAAIIAVMIAGLSYWIYDQIKVRDAILARVMEKIDATDANGQRRFNTLTCKVDLAIYLHQFPKGGIDWSTLPSSFYECMPNFKLKQ